MKKDQPCKIPRWQQLKRQLNNLSAEAFKSAIYDCETPHVIDVRTAAEFASGHIPGAINIDYLSESFWDKIEALPMDKTYFVYCRSGRRSIRTCTLMRNGGFDSEKLFNIDGGYKDWG